MALIDELLVALGFEFDPEDGDQFINQTEVVSSAINRIAIAAGAAQAALFAMANSSATTNDNLAKTARALDTSAESLAAWQFAAETAGVDGDALVGTLENLRQISQEAVRSGTGPFRAFSELGVDFAAIASGGQDVTEALDGIIARAQQMDRATAQAGLRELGIDVRLLDAPIDQLRDFVQEGREFSGVTNDLTDASEAFENAWARMQLRLGGVFNLISADLLPVMTELLNDTSEFLEYIQSDGVPALNEFVEAIGGWETVIVALTAATGLPAFLKLLTGTVTLAKALPGIFGAAATAAGAFLGVVGAAAAGVAIGNTILESLTPEERALVGEGVARGLALFGNDEAIKAVETNTGKRPFVLSEAFPSSGGTNPALAGTLRGQRIPTGGGQNIQNQRNVSITNNFMGVSASDLREIMRQQEQEATEQLNNDVNDSFVR